MGSYNPTNTALSSCPTVGANWGAVASPLPPAANPQLCTCMMASLTCQVNPSTDSDNFEDLFGQVCGYDDGRPCAGIAHNATTGTFGAYGMCNSTEQLSWAFNAYASSQSNMQQACDFNGAARTKASSSAGSSCSALMAEAGPSGQGTVTSSPSGGAAATSSGAAGIITVPAMDFGILKMGAYVAGAVVAGASLILL